LLAAGGGFFVTSIFAPGAGEHPKDALFGFQTCHREDFFIAERDFRHYFEASESRPLLVGDAGETGDGISWLKAQIASALRNFPIDIFSAGSDREKVADGTLCGLLKVLLAPVTYRKASGSGSISCRRRSLDLRPLA
jgi:hypothetical protein